MSKRTLIYGATVLMGANLLNRFLGFIYQYLIMTHIGAEAYGLFNMVFPIYMMALVLTTAGIPLAVSKLVSEEIAIGNYRQAKAIFRLALGILSCSGVLLAVILYILAVNIAGKVLPDPRAALVLLICVPAIFIVSVSSAFRGYFQGLQNMLPTALSQTIEQIVRVSCGFFLAVYLLPQGVVWAAVGLALGMLAGEAVGLLSIALNYHLMKFSKMTGQKKALLSRGVILARIWQLALPITAGRLLSTSQAALDAIIIPTRLQAAGYTAHQATTLFGQLGGAALPLLNFPSVFTFALATSLVPAIAEAKANQSIKIIKDRCAKAIRVTIILGLPCLVIMFCFAEPLAAIFKSANIAPVLRILALGGIFSYLQHITTAILQGLGKAHLPMLHTIAAAGIRIPLLYWLTGLPNWGLLGSASAFIVGFAVVAILNFIAIIRQTGLQVDRHRFVLQPLAAALGMLLAFHLLMPFNDDHMGIFLYKLVAGVMIYLMILIVNRGIELGKIHKIIILRR